MLKEDVLKELYEELDKHGIKTAYKFSTWWKVDILNLTRALRKNGKNLEDFEERAYRKYKKAEKYIKKEL